MIDIVQPKYAESKNKRKTICINNAANFRSTTSVLNRRQIACAASCSRWSTSSRSTIPAWRRVAYSEKDVRRFRKETVYKAAKDL